MKYQCGSSFGTSLEARRQLIMFQIIQRLRNALGHQISPAENLVTDYSSNRVQTVHYGPAYDGKRLRKSYLEFEGF